MAKIVDFDKPLCPFCSHPWTDDMVKVFTESSGGCETCGYGGYTSYELDITCEECGKLIYRKEGRGEY